MVSVRLWVGVAFAAVWVRNVLLLSAYLWCLSAINMRCGLCCSAVMFSAGSFFFRKWVPKERKQSWEILLLSSWLPLFLTLPLIFPLLQLQKSLTAQHFFVPRSGWTEKDASVGTFWLLIIYQTPCVYYSCSLFSQDRTNLSSLLLMMGT